MRGAKSIGSFRVSLGQGVGNLVYIVAYEDGSAAEAAEKKLANNSEYQALLKQTEPLIASMTTAVLHPLPDSALR